MAARTMCGLVKVGKQPGQHQDSISIVSCEDIAHIIKKRCNVVVEPRDVVFRFKRWALREFPGTYQDGGKRADLPEMGTVYTLKLLVWRKNW